MNEVDQALVNWNANEPTGQLFGHDSTYTITANGLLQRPDGNILQTAEKFKPLVITYVNGRPVRLEEVANVADSVETVTQAAWLYTKQGRQRAITLQVQKQPGTNVIQVTDAVRKVLPEPAGAVAAVGAPEHPPGPLAHDPPGLQRHPDHDAHHARARRGRDLSVPPQLVGHAHSGARPAVLDPRHLRGDEDAGLQPRQPVDDGAHPLDRLRRGRRHRDAGEHRAAHGGGRTAARGRAQRLARDRLHHPDDDDVARRRLHPDPVHGRHPRAPLPRVRRHDHHRRPDLGHRVRDADADAVQPLPEGRAQEGRPGRPDGPRLRRPAARLRAGASASSCATAW